MLSETANYIHACSLCYCYAKKDIDVMPLVSAYVCRADSRFAPSQWETALLCNDVSHWLGANLESALCLDRQGYIEYITCYSGGYYRDHYAGTLSFSQFIATQLKIGYLSISSTSVAETGQGWEWEGTGIAFPTMATRWHWVHAKKDNSVPKW